MNNEACTSRGPLSGYIYVDQIEGMEIIIADFTKEIDGLKKGQSATNSRLDDSIARMETIAHKQSQINKYVGEMFLVQKAKVKALEEKVKYLAWGLLALSANIILIAFLK